MPRGFFIFCCSARMTRIARIMLLNSSTGAAFEAFLLEEPRQMAIYEF